MIITERDLFYYVWEPKYLDNVKMNIITSNFKDYYQELNFLLKTFNNKSKKPKRKLILKVFEKIRIIEKK